MGFSFRDVSDVSDNLLLIIVLIAFWRVSKRITKFNPRSKALDNIDKTTISRITCTNRQSQLLHIFI